MFSKFELQSLWVKFTHSEVHWTLHRPRCKDCTDGNHPCTQLQDGCGAAEPLFYCHYSTCSLEEQWLPLLNCLHWQLRIPMHSQFYTTLLNTPPRPRDMWGKQYRHKGVITGRCKNPFESITTWYNLKQPRVPSFDQISTNLLYNSFISDAARFCAECHLARPWEFTKLGQTFAYNSDLKSSGRLIQDPIKIAVLKVSSPNYQTTYCQSFPSQPISTLQEADKDPSCTCGVQLASSNCPLNYIKDLISIPLQIPRYVHRGNYRETQPQNCSLSCSDFTLRANGIS